MKKQTVVIIGAGPAGLTAGYELLKTDEYNVIVLEADKQVGGISKTINYNGNRMDIGGHRFFSKNADIVKWWTDILPLQGKPSLDDKILNRSSKLNSGGPDPEKTNTVMLIRNRFSRIYYNKKFFDYPISMKLQTFKNLGITKTINSGFSYLKTTIIKKPETSLENFYINRFGKSLYSTFFENYTEKVWGRHPSLISADWGSQRVKGLSIKALLSDIITKNLKLKNRKIETSLIEEFYYPKHGPGQLWEEVANKIIAKGGIIKYHHEVISINTNQNKINSVICDVNGKKEEIHGDIFISSMPIKDLILGMNQVPSKVANIAKGLPYRDFVTIGLLVDKLKIKNETNHPTLNNLVPDCWIYVQEPNVKLGRIQIFNNWSPYLVKDPNKTVWLGLEYFCTEGDDFWSKPSQELIKLATNELINIGIIDKDSIIDSHSEKIKKAYPAYFDTYKDIDQVKKYLNKVSNLYCIGRNGQHHYNNMDHSMLTAIKAVEVITGQISDKKTIWQVNTEASYHEKKSV